MSAILNKIIHKIFYLVSIILIVVTLLIVSFRALTPLLNVYKTNLEHWVSSYFKADISVGYIKSHWYGLYPELRFQNVIIYDKEKKTPKIHINELTVDLDIVKTIFSLNLQPKLFEISGVSFEAKYFAKSQIDLKDIIKKGVRNIENTSSINTKKIFIWLFAQPHIVLKQINIFVHTKANGVIPLTIKHVELESYNKKHYLSGSVSTANPFFTSANFIALVTGNINDADNLAIDSYISFHKIHGLVPRLKIYDYNFNWENLSGDVWIKWKNKKWQSLQSLFNVKELTVKDNRTTRKLKINSISGNTALKITEQGWQLTVDHLKLNTDKHHWPENALMISSDKRGEQLFIHKADISETQKILNFFNVIPKDITEILSTLKSSGSLNNLLVQRTSNLGEIKLSTEFNNLLVNKWKDFPGIKGLSGTIALESKQGSLSLNSTNSQFDFGKLFAKPLKIKKLVSSINWRQLEDKEWLIKINKVKAVNEHVVLYGQGAVHLPPINKKDYYPTVSLLAGFDVNDSRVVKKYLPLTVLDADVIDWLNHAFVRGKGASGKAIIRGNLKHFPFDKNEGTFIVDAKVRDTDLYYAPSWPTANHINAELTFSGNSMWCKADAGQVYDSKVGHFKANIPYMGEDKPIILYLNGTVNGKAEDAFRYLKESPLHEDVGEAVDELAMRGKTKLTLNIKVPLENPEATTVKGTADFSAAKLIIPKFNMQLNSLNGKLFFTEELLWSNKITGILFDSPINLILSTKQHQNKSKETQVKLNGRASIPSLSKHFKWLKFPGINGAADYKANLYLPIFHKGTEKKQNLLVLSSSLQGIIVNVPSLFVKPAKKKEQFNFWLWFGGKKPMKLLCGVKNKLSTASLFDDTENEKKLFNMYVHFGEKPAEIKTKKGLFVDGYLPTFNWSYWYDYLQSIKSKDGSEITRNYKEFLTAIDIQIGRITILQQKLINTAFHITANIKEWRIKLINKETSGEITVPYDFSKGTLRGNFKKLFLHPLDTKQKKLTSINPQDFPELEIHADNFKYGQQDIGEITLSAFPESNSLQIKRLNIVSPLINAEVKGWWRQQDNNYTSNLEGNAVSENINELLTKFNLFPSLMVQRGKVQFSLTWPKAIYKLVFKKMTGNIKVDLNKGRVIDLGQQADAKLNVGRFLTLLSVNRFLMLDFSDLAHKGYSFDVLQGKFSIDEGKLTTDNLMFDGSVAKIKVKGVIDTVKQKLALKMTVIPYLTSSLPVVATIAGGPIAGAVTWLADKALGESVGKLTAYHYFVQGNLDDPVITEVKG